MEILINPRHQMQNSVSQRVLVPEMYLRKVVAVIISVVDGSALGLLGGLNMPCSNQHIHIIHLIGMCIREVVWILFHCNPEIL